MQYSTFVDIKSQVTWWMVENGKKLSMGLLIVFTSTSGIYFTIHKWKKSPIETYLNADNMFQTLYLAPDKDKMESFEKILSNNQTLHAKYDSLIVHPLMSIGQSQEAAAYANKVLDRIGKQTPFHARFLKISALINQKQYDKALEESLNFKRDLEMHREFFTSQSSGAKYGYLLYAFNLVRVGMLYKALGKSQEELQAWKEYLVFSQNLKQNSVPELYDDEAIQQLKAAVSGMGITLEEYIKQRAEVLSKSLN